MCSFGTILTLAVCVQNMSRHIVPRKGPFVTLIVSWTIVLLPAALIGVYAGCLRATITFVACKAALIVDVETLNLAVCYAN